MRLLKLFASLVIGFAMTACATVPPTPAVAMPLRIDQLQELSVQGLSDDALIALVEQQGVSFVLSQSDLEAQRKAGVSEGVLRYLQGRAAGEQALRGRIMAGRYLGASYFGLTYLGYPYLGYHDGLHYYGGQRYYGGPISYWRAPYGWHIGGHRGGGHH